MKTAFILGIGSGGPLSPGRPTPTDMPPSRSTPPGRPPVGRWRGPHPVLAAQKDSPPVPKAPHVRKFESIYGFQQQLDFGEPSQDFSVRVQL